MIIVGQVINSVIDLITLPCILRQGSSLELSIFILLKTVKDINILCSNKEFENVCSIVSKVFFTYSGSNCENKFDKNNCLP